MLEQDRNASARVLLDIRAGYFVVLLDHRIVAYSDDVYECMHAFRCISRAVQHHGEML